MPERLARARAHEMNVIDVSQQIFDKQITLRMGQANVKRLIDDILPLLDGDEDPLGVDDFATHRLPLTENGALGRI